MPGENALASKGFFRILFPLVEFRCSLAIAHGFLLLLPGLAAIFQSLIVNITSAAEGSGQLRRLPISGEESIFERLLRYHGNILHHFSGLFTRC